MIGLWCHRRELTPEVGRERSSNQCLRRSLTGPSKYLEPLDLALVDQAQQESQLITGEIRTKDQIVISENQY